MTATTKAPSTTAGPTNFTNPLPALAPIKPFNSTPIRGKRGTSQTSWMKSMAAALSFQQIHLVHVDRVALAEDGDDDSEAHGDLGSGDRHHKESEDLPVKAAPLTGKGDEGQVDRIEHQLDA